MKMEGKEDVYSPDGVLEDYFRTVESETASTSETEVEQNPKPESRWRSMVQLLKSRSKRPLSTLHPLSVLKLSRRSSSSSSSTSEDISGATSSLVDYTLPELQSATNCFSHGLSSASKFLVIYTCRKQLSKIHVTFRP